MIMAVSLEKVLPRTSWLLNNKKRKVWLKKKG
jgi:hypothetical protein